MYNFLLIVLYFSAFIMIGVVIISIMSIFERRRIKINSFKSMSFKPGDTIWHINPSLIEIRGGTDHLMIVREFDKYLLCTPNTCLGTRFLRIPKMRVLSDYVKVSDWESESFNENPVLQ